MRQVLPSNGSSVRPAEARVIRSMRFWMVGGHCDSGLRGPTTTGHRRATLSSVVVGLRLAPDALAVFFLSAGRFSDRFMSLLARDGGPRRDVAAGPLLVQPRTKEVQMANNGACRERFAVTADFRRASRLVSKNQRARASRREKVRAHRACRRARKRGQGWGYDRATDWTF